MLSKVGGSRPRRRVTLALLGVGAAAATLAIASTGAGAAPTRPAVDGAHADHGPVAVKNMNLTGTQRMPASTARAAAAASGQLGNFLYAISPGHQRVMAWDNTSPGGGWHQIGGAAAHLYAGLGHLFATNPSSGNVYEYSGSNSTWYYVGGPGKVFIPGKGPDGNFALYGLSPGGQRVMMWQEGRAWKQVGGAAGWLYSGPYGDAYATNPNTGNIYQYRHDLQRWVQIGTRGRSFAGNGNNLYAITPDGQAVMHWDGTPMHWTKVGDAAGQIHAGGNRVIATNPTNGDAYTHVDGGAGWARIGGPGQDFQIDGSVFGQNPTGIYAWSGSGTDWDKIGGPAAEMAVAY